MRHVAIIVACLLPFTMPEDSEKRVLEKRKKSICAVKNYIDENYYCP